MLAEEELLDIFQMQRFTNHDHPFIRKDACIANGDFPMFISENTANENFTVK